MTYLPSALPTSGLVTLLGKGGLAGVELFSREILVLQTIVAGTPFYKALHVQEQLTPGATLTLEREPDNKYDELAIKILVNGHHIGYIPRDRNEVVARLMDAGKLFTAKVLHLDCEGAHAIVEIDVFLKD